MYVVIAGGGKIGQYLANTLLKKGNEVAVIEKDKKTSERLSAYLSGQYLVINGDGCDSRYLEDAGIKQADIFVAVSGHDDVNLVACEVAKRVYFVDRCIARVNSPNNIKIFEKIGIEPVASTLLISNIIEGEALGISMKSTIALLQSNVVITKHHIKELKTSDEGILAKDVDMPSNSIIIAVSYEDTMEVVGPETVIYQGDDVVVASSESMIEKVTEFMDSL